MSQEAPPKIIDARASVYCPAIGRMCIHLGEMTDEDRGAVLESCRSTVNETGFLDALLVKDQDVCITQAQACKQQTEGKAAVS